MLNPMTRIPLAAALLTSLFLTGCLGSLRPDAPQSIRFYSAAPDIRVDRDPTVDVSGSMRLGQIRAADHLSNRMVWRVSDVEYGFYELSRWTEAPEEYLERTLDKALFQSRGIPQSSGSDALVLNAKLVGFEEDLSQGRQARVAVAFSLQRGSSVLWSGTLETKIPIDADDRAQTAAAIRSALTDVVARAAAITLGLIE
jgi:ABC-type uncharacterized transport system auxiliary subunit